MQIQTAVEMVRDAVAVGVPQDQLAEKLDRLIALAEQQITLEQIARLDGGDVLRLYPDTYSEMRLCLPEAATDYMQHWMLRNNAVYEHRLLATISSMKLIGPESVVCDVGAYIGTHAVYFGRVLQARRVVAIEPQKNAHDRLCRNLALNGMTDSYAYHCLAGPKTGRGEVAKWAQGNLGATTFAPDDDGRVPMVALDDLIDAPEMAGLSFLKIDAPKMQWNVMQGAAKLIAAARPAIWLDLHARDPQMGDVRAMLEGLRYDTVRIGPTDWVFTPQ